MRLVLTAVLLLAAAAQGVAQRASQPARLVAIGDIHGAYDEFVTILKRSGLINDALAWSGGRATLVQTGDYTDRGTDVRKVLDLLMRLEREAKSAGGQIQTLLGNHEIMNLIGDWRDVTPEICATFATAKSEAKREDTYRQYTRLASHPAPAAQVGIAQTTPPVAMQPREAWMLDHPVGCLEYREAMAPNGTYGRWLRDKPIAARVGDSLFMHAGINPSRPVPTELTDVITRARTELRRIDAHRQRLAGKRLALPTASLQDILDVSVSELRNATAAVAAAKAEGQAPPELDYAVLRESQDLMEVGTWSLIDPQGPLWFRGYAQWDEATAAPQVFAFLDAMKLTRVVVGHTVTPTRKITTRFGGRVVLIDTGMLARAYQGNPAALEISGVTLKAIYPTEEVVLTSTPATPAPPGPSH